MVDYDALILAVTMILFFVIVGGTILLFPLTRKLGHLLEARTRQARGKGLDEEPEIRRILARLDALDGRLDAIDERQEFLDRLLTEQRPARRIESAQI